jgi:hypothetical protein
MPRQPKPEPDEAETPGVEELRRSLARKLEAFVAEWRRCPRGACRRHRACHAPQSGCRSLPSARPMSEEQWAREKAWFMRALERRRDELERTPHRGSPMRPAPREPSR